MGKVERMHTSDRARVLAAAVAGARRDRLGRAEWSAHQSGRLREFLDFVAANSPFHRRRLGAARDVESLRSVPVLERTEMMAHFDDAVTDRRLTRAKVNDHVATMVGTDPMLLDEFRVLTTGGTSGVATYVPFNRTSWINVVSAYPQLSAVYGFPPRAFPRRRLALLTAGGPLHMTYRAAETNRSPVMAMMRLDVTSPIAELGRALESFEPDLIVGYPSVLAALAEAVAAGRFTIRPAGVSSSSEQLRPAMLETISRVWPTPYNVYATTETAGPLAFECTARDGLHIREDWNVVEVVDPDDQPVPDGTTGASLLVTSWINPTMPIIRYRLDDQVAITSEPCLCGRPSRRITALTGRVEDTVRLSDRAGNVVPVHPNHFEETIEGRPGVGQYQVLHRPDSITVSVVPTADAPIGWDDSLRSELERRIAGVGAVVPPIHVVAVADLPRPATNAAKLQIVRSEV